MLNLLRSTGSRTLPFLDTTEEFPDHVSLNRHIIMYRVNINVPKTDISLLKSQIIKDIQSIRNLLITLREIAHCFGMHPHYFLTHSYAGSVLKSGSMFSTLTLYVL